MDQPHDSAKNLIKFMQQLVNDQAELQLYKQDPVAYLAQSSLTDKDRELLGTLIAPDMRETSTVFRLTITPLDQASPNQPPDPSSKSIPLDEDIEFYCPHTPVILEAGASPYTYLLPDSRIATYIDTDTEEKASFNLSVLFINKDDDRSKPFTFTLRTHKQVGDGVPMQQYSLVDLTLEGKEESEAFVLPYNHVERRSLVQGSNYDPSTGVLTLYFENPPKS